MIHRIPVEHGPISLSKAQADAGVWDGSVFIRLIDEPGTVYVIDGERPVTLAEATARVRAWRAENEQDAAG